MSFGTGWKPDLPEHVHVGAEYERPLGAIRSPSPRPANYSLRQFYDAPIQDQNGASACVGFAMARAIYIRSCVEFAKGGRSTPLPYPSEQAIYTLARDPAGALDVIPDDGCFPRLAVYALATFGIVAGGRWKFDMRTITQHVPPDVLRAGADALVSGFVPIPTGDFDGIRDAIYAGFPVVGGLIVDDIFRRYSGGIMPDNDGSNHGGHMQCLVGFGETVDENGDVLEYLEDDNSWGSTDWGESGKARLGRARSERIRDLYALHLAPEVAE